MIVKELECRNGLYNISNIISQKSWVNQETAELILLEYNAGVEDDD